MGEGAGEEELREEGKTVRRAGEPSASSEGRTRDQVISKEQSAHAGGVLTCNYNRLEEEFLEDFRRVFAVGDFYQQTQTHTHTPFDTCNGGFPAERQTQLNLIKDWTRSTNGSWSSTTNNND